MGQVWAKPAGARYRVVGLTEHYVNLSFSGCRRLRVFMLHARVLVGEYDLQEDAA